MPKSPPLQPQTRTPQPASHSGAADSQGATLVPGNVRQRIRTLDDLQGRCRIDDETGCWRWAGAMASKAADPVPYANFVNSDGRRVTMPAARLAWLLSGRPLPAGHVVYRAACLDRQCVNPAHGKAGTMAQLHAHYSASGKNKGNPHRAAVNAINRLVLATPVEKVREAEALFEQGMGPNAVARAIGVSYDVAKRIARRQHPHSSNALRVIRGASVFTLAEAA